MNNNNTDEQIYNTFGVRPTYDTGDLQINADCYDTMIVPFPSVVSDARSSGEDGSPPPAKKTRTSAKKPAPRSSNNNSNAIEQREQPMPIYKEPCLSMYQAMSEMMANNVNQQNHITYLNNHLHTMGFEYRSRMCDIDKKYLTENLSLKKTLNLNKSAGEGRELQLKSQIEQSTAENTQLVKTLAMAVEKERIVNECNTQLKGRIASVEQELILANTTSSERIKQLEEELVVLGDQLNASNQRILELENPPLPVRVVVEALVHDDEPPKQEKKRKFVKLEETKVTPNALYTWSVVEVSSPRCVELYGFDAKQIQSLYNRMNTIRNASKDENKSKKGCKASIDDEVFFLSFLYFFKHYATMRCMQEKFQITTSHLQSHLLKTVTSHSKAFYRVSNQREAASMENDVRVYRCYFFTVNKPIDPALSQKYYSPLYKLHGLFVHCIHRENGNGKVIEFYTSMRKKVETAWVESFIDNEDEEDQKDDGNYEERMKSKFEIAITKYRGNLSELHNIVECVLALTNFDIEYDNPIEVGNMQVEIEM